MGGRKGTLHASQGLLTLSCRQEVVTPENTIPVLAHQIIGYFYSFVFSPLIPAYFNVGVVHTLRMPQVMKVATINSLKNKKDVLQFSCAPLTRSELCLELLTYWG